MLVLFTDNGCHDNNANHNAVADGVAERVKQKSFQFSLTFVIDSTGYRNTQLCRSKLIRKFRTN